MVALIIERMWTSPWLVFLMAVGRLLVFVEVRLESETLVADGAPKTLGRRVRLHVGAQVRSVSERLEALVARVRLLSRVRPDVTLQQPRSRERLRAYGTYVLPPVRQQMHRQRRHRHVRLAARRATLGAARLDGTMRLLVARQVRRCGVVSVALVAAEAARLAAAAAPQRQRRPVRRRAAVRRGTVGHGRRQRRVGRFGRFLVGQHHEHRRAHYDRRALLVPRLVKRRQRVGQLEQIVRRFRVLGRPLVYDRRHPTADIVVIDSLQQACRLFYVKTRTFG